MKLRIAAAIVLVVLVVGALAGIKTMQIRKMIAGGKAMPRQTETVSTVVARQDTWPNTLGAIASITAVRGVTVTPDIPGTVVEIAFESGATVKEGDLLVRLDVSSETAQLAAVQAQVELSRVNLERVATLRKEKMVSQSDLDTAEATLKQTQANAEAIRATINKKTIRAPFAGKLGIRQINLGEYLDTGKAIVSLQSLSPVYAGFTLPQQEIAKLKPGLSVRLTTDAYPGQEFEGTLSALNPDLNAQTRSVTVQATFENKEQLLRPGMFARAEVVLPQETQVLAIPATAILSSPYGDSVYIVKEETDTNGTYLAASQQFVRTGRARGDFVSVESGLKSGDKIVKDGVFKLRNKAAIKENNEMAPKASETPTPADS